MSECKERAKEKLIFFENEFNKLKGENPDILQIDSIFIIRELRTLYLVIKTLKYVIGDEQE